MSRQADEYKRFDLHGWIMGGSHKSRIDGIACMEPREAGQGVHNELAQMHVISEATNAVLSLDQLDCLVLFQNKGNLEKISWKDLQIARKLPREKSWDVGDGNVNLP